MEGRGRSKSHVSDSGNLEDIPTKQAVGTGNPAARPWLVRIYGMVGCLAMTLAFIGIIVWLEKKLPDGSKSQFHPTWRRDAHFDTLETRANVSSVSGVLVETSIFCRINHFP